MNKQEKVWLNIFIRDALLSLVLYGIHYMTRFNSKTVFLITGMLMVYITWHLSDYLNYKKLQGLKWDGTVL